MIRKSGIQVVSIIQLLWAAGSNPTIQAQDSNPRTPEPGVQAPLLGVQSMEKAVLRSQIRLLLMKYTRLRSNMDSTYSKISLEVQNVASESFSETNMIFKIVWNPPGSFRPDFQSLLY